MLTLRDMLGKLYKADIIDWEDYNRFLDKIREIERGD